MGWSESYYADMQREAERELNRCAMPLLERTLECREALTAYGDFSQRARELDAILAVLQGFLEECLQGE